MPLVLERPAAQAGAISGKQRRGQYVPSSDEFMRRNARDIIALALNLERRGTRVVLFQLPVAPEIFEQPRQQATRRIMREEVGAHTNLSMDLSLDGSEIRWSDGAHLDERSSILVIRAMERWLVERLQPRT